MTATPVISVVSGKAALDAMLAKLNVASLGGKLKIYSGSPPATTETAASGTLLSTCRFSTSAFSGATNTTTQCVGTANTIISDSSAANTGTAGYFRATDSADVVVLQGTAATSSADLILNTTSIVAGGQVAISSYTVTLPTQ